MNRYLDPILKLLDPRTRELPPEPGDLSCSAGEVRGVELGSRTLTALVSTPNVDRYEEIVEPKAFKKWLKVFMSNPVFVAGHTYGGRSGEPTVIGHWADMQITDEGLVGTAKFASTPLAEQYLQLYHERHMRAFSVGWITHEWEMREFELVPGVKKRIRVFTQVELIEVSAVAIPANRESLVRAASAGAPGMTPPAAFDEKALQRLIQEEVRGEIRKQLNTDTDGLMANLIQDVVEACHARGAHACEHDDVPGTPESAPEETGAKDLLRQLA